MQAYLCGGKFISSGGKSISFVVKMNELNCVHFLHTGRMKHIWFTSRFVA